MSADTILSPSSELQIERIERDKQAMTVHWHDGEFSTFHYLWLRDNCLSGFHPDTGERSFSLLSVSIDIHPLEITHDDEYLNILWSEGNHRSHYPLQWLRGNSYAGSLRVKHEDRYTSWVKDFANQIPAADHASLVDDNQALYQWMKQLDRYGLILVNGMPTTTDALESVATRIDYLRQTNFGISFDVRSEPSPINLAYTSIGLPLHTDLPNQEVPPGYQFLHCLENSTEGGESIFIDGFSVLETLRSRSPDDFRLLAEHAIPFRYFDASHDIRYHHPVIHLDAFGSIIELKFNAHIASTFDLPETIMYDYYCAYRHLMELISDPSYRIEFRLQPGQMVVFDNRRVLHGRNAFDENSGHRHLRGCYVDRTEFQSRLRVLARQFS